MFILYIRLVENRSTASARLKSRAALAGAMRLRLGLAAWSNSHFDNALYPLGTPHKEHLPRYAGLFDVAEADVLHHQMPKAQTLAEWIAQTPEGFLFLPKMHKWGTH